MDKNTGDGFAVLSPSIPRGNGPFHLICITGRKNISVVISLSMLN